MFAKDYNEKYDFSGKKIEELQPNELSILRGLLEMLPEGVNYTITRTDTKQHFDYIDEFVDDMIEDFFNVSDEDYENLVGKCFVRQDKREVIKVVGMTDDEKINFLFERYIKHADDTWDKDDFNWLQDEVHGKYPNKEYEKYCLTDQTNMNISSESMYMLGKDGNLYVDVTCGNDYDVYVPLKNAAFDLIREEAFGTF